MNAKSKIIARIAMVMMAAAILIGINGGLASAEPSSPVDIDSASVLIARGLCTGSGGSWNITNGVFFCTYGNAYTGHGWACDMNATPITCWTFFKPATPGITASVGPATLGNTQVATTSGDSSGMPVNVSSVQAQIAAVATATPQPTPTRVKVATAGKVSAVMTKIP